MADGDGIADASPARDVIVRPCPNLFPSFTVTMQQMNKFCRIYAKVSKDTYLPQGYRKGARQKPFRGIVADTRHYVMREDGSKCSALLEERRAKVDKGCRVMRLNKKTGEIELYSGIAEAAKFNARSAATLRRQIAEGFSPKSLYVFEIHGKEG